MLQRFAPLAMVLGLAALYLGERALGSGAPRWVLSGAGLTLIAFALALATWRMLGATGDRRAASSKLVASYALCTAAVALYFAQTPELALIPAGKAQTVVMVAWPALAIFGLLPALSMELALSSMAKAPTLETWRVSLGARAARIVVLAFVAFAGANFAASKWSHKVDLSYFKTTKPGVSTLALVEGLSSKVEVLLFFPPGNAVLDHALNYFEDLATANRELLVLRIVDQAVDIDLARDLKIRDNGHVVLRAAERHELLKLDLDLEDARATLRNLDAEVQQRLLKVSRPARVAYLTTGHLERDWQPMESDKRPGLSDLKAMLESQGFSVRRLGMAEGLGNAVPDDATLVLTVGPTEAFQAGEVAALHAYLARGGKWMVFFDPDYGLVQEELVRPLGLSVGKSLAAAESRYLVRVEGRGESPYFMATSQWATHPTTTSLQAGQGRVFVVALGASAITRRDDAPASASNTFALRTMQNSFEDHNGNTTFDEKSEKRDILNLAAAVELKTSDANAPPARALVVSDADMVATGVLRNPGNAFFALDAVRWLAGEEKIAGAVESEKDVPLVHKKDKDAIWFYGTSFIMPALVLAGGFAITRRARAMRKEG